LTEGSPSASADRIEAALGEILPVGAAVAVWSGGEGGEWADPLLGPAEREAVRQAVPKRRLEFARGRHAARRALERAGWTGGFIEIPVGDTRQPLWPAGFTGSITHCDGLVAAVAARFIPALAAIGLDAEPARPLPEGVRGQVLTPAERDIPGAEMPTVVFSAKEALHKAVFPGSGIWLDFLDVTLTLDRDTTSFRAAPTPGASVTTPEVDQIVGRYLLVEGFVLTLAWIPG
jgi:4'-phosphopantetheinyl transferase EntD